MRARSHEMPGAAIDAYLRKLEAALHGPRTAKADLLAEVRDALVDAAAASMRERGDLDRDAAGRRAVAEFGNIGDIAPAYQAELGLAQARRTALLMFGIMAAQPLAWASASLVLSRAVQAPTRSPSWYLVASDGVEWLGAGTLIAAGLMVFATGIGVRWLGVRAEVPRAIGLFALLAAPIFSVLGMALTAFSPVAPQLIDAGGLVLLTLFVLLPMGFLAISGRSCLMAAPEGHRG